MAAVATIPAESEFLTTDEVAELLGVSPGTVRAYANAGVLPSIRYTPKSPRRFPREGVDRLLRESFDGAAASDEAARQHEEPVA